MNQLSPENAKVIFAGGDITLSDADGSIIITSALESRRIARKLNEFADNNFNGSTLVEEKTCKWTDDEDYWETDCGELFQIIAGTLKDNKYKFCPNCGRRILEEIKIEKKQPQCSICLSIGHTEEQCEANQ